MLQGIWIKAFRLAGDDGRKRGRPTGNDE